MKNLEPDLLGTITGQPAARARTSTRARKAIRALLAAAAGLAVLVHFGGDPLLNRFVKPRLQQALSANLPGYSLQLGVLRYGFLGNRLECDAVTVTFPDGRPATAGAISVQGVRWGRWLLGNRHPDELCRRARIDVTDFSAMLASGEYRIRCGQLRLSVPDSEITAQAITVQPVTSDDVFFAAEPYRRTHYHFSAASGALRGVGVPDLLHGRAYRAASIELVRPVLDSLTDRDKPSRTATANHLTPSELLAAIDKPFRIDRLTISDGLIRYRGQRYAGANPGVLVFTAVRIAGEDIANAAAGGHSIALSAEGRLMDAGTLRVQLQIPVTSPALSFHYSGKLDAMELTGLDGYLTGAARFEIKSGAASEVRFDIDVVDGHARGLLHGVYRNLQVRILDTNTGSEKGAANRVATVLANQLKVRRDNPAGAAAAAREGKVDYVRKPEESFGQFAWIALRSGILDLISP